ncbi:MAG: efflux RND transporter permease subunit [Saprospiraceae bacterium]|nr:efflux RND transporter permease subunit [Saprospiraceae bacterium]
MDSNDNKIEKGFKEFKLSTLALKNKNTVYMLAFMLIIFGMRSYVNLPKELMPDIALPYVMVQTIYPGNPPVDIENLITRPIEKEVETIKGIKQISSTSSEDFSMIVIEFNSDVDIKDALQDVKDAVDKTKSDLPNDLPSDPIVADIDFTEFPIQNINLYGDYSIDELKKYAEILEEEIETISEVSKVNIQGINEKEVKINVDQHKLESFELTFHDIENAVVQENVSISGGEIKLKKTRRSIRTIGEFVNAKEMENIIVKTENNNIVYLRDVAEVIDGYEDPSTITRLNGKPVVSVQVVKKGGENILSATTQIEKILKNAREEKILPDDLNIVVTNDQSEMVKMQLSNLENSMIISIILVIMVLFFFLGTRNALFVGMAIPLSMVISF